MIVKGPWTVEVRVHLTADLRRAAEYRAGRRLADAETVRLLERDLRDTLDRWAKLGRWLADVEADDAQQPSRVGRSQREQAGCYP